MGWIVAQWRSRFPYKEEGGGSSPPGPNVCFWEAAGLGSLRFHARQYVAAGSLSRLRSSMESACLFKREDVGSSPTGVSFGSQLLRWHLLPVRHALSGWPSGQRRRIANPQRTTSPCAGSNPAPELVLTYPSSSYVFVLSSLRGGGGIPK